MIYAHTSRQARRIWEERFGPIPAGLEVDHRDGDSRNQSPDNLRLATRMQNNWNRRKYKNNTSGEKGVKLDAKKHRWQVKVHAGPVRVYANASSKMSAILAARLIRRVLHGSFAIENRTPCSTNRRKRKMNTTLTLGAEYKDRITGFTGICTGETVYISG